MDMYLQHLACLCESTKIPTSTSSHISTHKYSAFRHKWDIDSTRDRRLELLLSSYPSYVGLLRKQESYVFAYVVDYLPNELPLTIMSKSTEYSTRMVCRAINLMANTMKSYL